MTNLLTHTAVNCLILYRRSEYSDNLITMTMYRDRDLAEIKKKLDEILLSPLSKLVSVKLLGDMCVVCRSIELL